MFILEYIQQYQSLNILIYHTIMGSACALGMFHKTILVEILQSHCIHQGCGAGAGAGAETFGWSRSRYTEVSAPAPGSGSRAN
jgi:hypothetical protein